MEERLSQFTPEELKRLFFWALFGLPVLAIVARWFFQNWKTPGSSFKLREADRKNLHHSQVIEAALSRGHASAKTSAKTGAKSGAPKPLQLGGISIHGLPHEILNVKEAASLKEIQKAYRDLMKRYHPDVMGRIGSREWKDAQKIAEAINQAKVEMMSKLQEKTPKRSGSVEQSFLQMVGFCVFLPIERGQRHRHSHGFMSRAKTGKRKPREQIFQGFPR